MGSNKAPFLLLFVMCFVLGTAVSQRYTVTDLGVLTPTGINTWAQVVGNYNDHAYIWSSSKGMHDLGLLPGGRFSEAAAINDLGVVTGTADGPGTVKAPDSGLQAQCVDLTQPFVWTSQRGMTGLNVLSPLGLGPGNPECVLLLTYATGINIGGQVVGYNQDYYTYQRGYLWSGNTITSFGGSWVPTSINAISNTGQMVGQNAVPYNFFYGNAVSWQPNGTMTTLATLDGTTDIFAYGSSANGVNDAGQIVGWSTTSPVSQWSGVGPCSDSYGPGCPIHAVLWASGGAIRNLGTLPGDTNSVAASVNLFGQVIGTSGNTFELTTGERILAEVPGRPFIWTERSGMRDLNSLLPRNSGWVLNTATGINIWGQIVGTGTRNGQTHGYLLTPTNPFQLF